MIDSELDRLKRVTIILREREVVLDADLAALLGIETKRLNEAIRRHGGILPEDSAFQLAPEELAALTSQAATSSSGHGGRRSLPMAFTVRGLQLLADILPERLRHPWLKAFIERAQAPKAPEPLPRPQARQPIEPSLPEGQGPTGRDRAAKEAELEAIMTILAARSLREYIQQAWPILEPGTPFTPGWHIDAIAAHLEAVSRGEVRKLLINMPPRHMKPMDVETPVLMGDGSRKRLGDIRVGDQVVTHRGRSRKVSDVFEQGELAVLEITTESGRVVRAAPDHPFLTPRGWVRAGDLTVGETLALVAPLDRCPSGRPPEEFRLAGYFVGDGSTAAGGHSIASTITSFDMEEALDIEHCAGTLGFVASRSGRKGRLDLSHGVRPWLREVGLAGGTSWTKRVPYFVFNASRDEIGHFLGAYFACDGTLNQRSHARKDLAVTFSSVNQPLLEDVRHLLLRLGVRSRVRAHIGRNNVFTGGDHLSWRLTITSQDDTAKFISRVPVFGAKAGRLAAWGLKRRSFNAHQIPDPIVSIEPSGQAQCRCLSVDDGHSFLANDLAVRNSLAVSVFWPTWEWITRPELGWLFASYAMSLAVRDSVKCRRIIESPWYQRRWGQVYQLTGDQNAKSRYDNTKMGYRIALSVDSAVTGEGGDRLVVDDPGNVREAQSEAIRASTISWWKEALSTRANNPKTVGRVVVMQRVHEEDLSGYILAAEDGWEHLCLPAEFEPKPQIQVSAIGWRDPRTAPGELLWPEQFGPKEMADLKQSLGSYGSAGQLQQRPAPAEGGMFKRVWWKFWHLPGQPLPPITVRLPDGTIHQCPVAPLPADFDLQLQSWDMAFKDTKASDYVVGQVWGRRAADNFLLDQVRDRMNFPETLQAVLELCRKHPEATTRLVEDKANGPAVIAALQSQVAGLIPVEPMGSKQARAAAASPQVESGNVYLPHPYLAPWVEGFIEEHASFPKGSHDDQVDSTSQALNRLGTGLEDPAPYYGVVETHFNPTAFRPGDIDVSGFDPGGQRLDLFNLGTTRRRSSLN